MRSAMKTPVKILLLEDNIYDAELLCATLEAGALPCRTVRVDTEAGFRKALEGPLDLIISDFTLPSFDGKRALAITRERRPDIPFIFVSGTIGEEKAIESLLAGATDYVIKPNFGRLLPAVKRALKEKEEQNARHVGHRGLLSPVFFPSVLQNVSMVSIRVCCPWLRGGTERSFMVGRTSSSPPSAFGPFRRHSLTLQIWFLVEPCGLGLVQTVLPYGH